MPTRSFDEKNSEISIVVEIESAKWVKAQEKAFNKLSKKLKINGFKVGSTSPTFLKEAKKRISSQQIWEEAIDDNLLKEALKEAATEIKETDLIISNPTYSVNKVSDTELSINFVYPTLPNYDDLDYKDLKIKLDDPKVSKEEIAKEVELFKERYSTAVETDEAAQVGDEVNIDFIGRINGDLFDGGSAEDHNLKLGSKTFIPGFEDQLVGTKAGEVKDVTVTFPADYYVKEYRAVEAVFTVTVNSVKRIQKIELNKAFFDEKKIPNIFDIKSLEETIQNNLRLRKLEEVKEKFMNKALETIRGKNTISVPRVILIKEMTDINNKFNDTLKQQGLSRKEYFELTKQNEEEFTKQIREEASDKIKNELIQIQISKSEKLEATNEDYDQRYVVLSAQYGISVDSVSQFLTKEQLQVSIVNAKIVDRLIELNDKKSYEKVVELERTIYDEAAVKSAQIQKEFEKETAAKKAEKKAKEESKKEESK